MPFYTTMYCIIIIIIILIVIQAKWRREKSFFGGFQDCCYVKRKVVGVCACISVVA